MKVLQFEGTHLEALATLKSVLGQHWFDFCQAYKESGQDLFTFTQMGEGEKLLRSFGVEFIWWC